MPDRVFNPSSVSLTRATFSRKGRRGGPPNGKRPPVSRGALLIWPKNGCHPGRARSAKIRDRRLSSALAAVPDRRPCGPCPG
ncbi:MAG: hypothetical protein B7Z42_11870 [Brevundimonas sp. 12-68-7]|nr:MAG: hypothetical protein B7Z42_11870 [Brevundimonas sp. 12-68-7]